MSAITAHLAPITDQSTDKACLRANTTAISARVNGLVMVLIAEGVALHEIPGIASLAHIVRTVGWQRIGSLFQMLSSLLLEAGVGARAAMALVARALQPEAFVLAFCSAFRLLGVMMLVSILAAPCFRKTLPPEGCSNSMPIRTPSTVDGARIGPIPAEVLQGE
ncbi:MAG: transporter [Bradyrhizobium sp.]|nr:transporter [Bradyrhizobium sp.]